MKAKDIYIQRVLNKFQEYKGKASVYCFHNFIIPELVYFVINKFLNKHRDATILIVVDKSKTRSSVINYVQNKIGISSKVSCILADYVKDEFHYKSDLLIMIGVNENKHLMTKLMNESKFTLSILTTTIKNYSNITAIRAVLPSIDVNDLDDKIKNDNITLPVEEIRCGITLSDKARLEYNEYDKYINESISIFKDINTVDKCRVGDANLNMSYMQICTTVAYENGWNENLDFDIPILKQIDDLYNPNALHERAVNFYNITRSRINFVCDTEEKYDKVKEICENNRGKKIIIVSKNGKCAAGITKYLNDSMGYCCGDYHDYLEDIAATDEYGNDILIKSGVHKGERKMIGHQAQSTLNERRFNDGYINILSIKFASNVKLKTACDILIFTTPLTGTIYDFKRRFTNIVINGNPILTYKLYCINTIEHTKIKKDKIHSIIVKDDIEDFIEYDKNSNDIIL